MFLLINSITLYIYTDDTVAALVASTLWFSLDAGKNIWSTASGSTEQLVTGATMKPKTRLAGLLAKKIPMGLIYESGNTVIEKEHTLSYNLAACIQYDASKRWRIAKLQLEEENFLSCHKNLYVCVLLSTTPGRSIFLCLFLFLCSLSLSFSLRACGHAYSYTARSSIEV